MDAQEWSKLKKNWTAIQELYPPSEIYDQLFQDGIFTQRDKQSIKKAGPSHEQMDKLMSILKSKPAETNAYRHFIKAVQKSSSWLASKIETTESDCDPALRAPEDPHSSDEDVRKILHENFVSKEGAEITLKEIRDTLNEHHVFKHGNEWKNEILNEFLEKEFIGVKIKTRYKRRGKSKEKVFCVINLEKIKVIVSTPKTAQKQELKTESASSKPKVDEKLDLKKLNNIQLKDYLIGQFKEQDYPTGILDTLEQEMITGEVFLTMKEADFKDILPSIPFGVRRFLTMLIETHSGTPSETPSGRLSETPKIPTYGEYLRRFDKNVEHTNKYVKGRCVDISVNIRGKSTVPIRNFHILQEQDKDKALEYIGAEVIPFASACLNDRRNGTIYFGISPENDQHFKAGEIVGVSLLKMEIDAELQDLLNKSFSSSQKNIILKTVRDVKLVPVITGEMDANLFVVEIDIVPSSELLQSDTIRTKLKCLPLFQKKYKSEDAVFKFSDDGFPKIVSCEDLNVHERDKPRIVQQRRIEETFAAPKYLPDLRSKFLRLLTGGKDVLEDSVFLFVMTSPIDAHMDEDYLQENISFLKRPEVIFDFDPKGATDGIYNNIDSKQNGVMRVLQSDDFDRSSSRSKEKHTEFIKSLANETHNFWVFCNGYEIMDSKPVDSTLWIRQRKSAFQKCVDFFTENFGKDRIIVIICLFSKDYTTMIEACYEVLANFSESWMLLAESEDVAKLFQEDLLRKHVVLKEELKDRCVIGMPWAQVNATMQQTIKDTQVHSRLVPCSTGALIEVNEKKINDWLDIDVLTAGDFELPSDENEKKRMEAGVKEKFYKGEQASWLNFLFHDHVMKRDIHPQFLETVKNSLVGKEKEEEDKVTVVPILHQPGAGGTTSAMQILWDLRKDFRCCVVKTITDQTSDQLGEVRGYGDKSPKPLLVLIDNEDEEKYLHLRENLETNGRRQWKHSDEHFDVYCTIILCVRRASLPRQLRNAEIALRQELTRKELEWFSMKNKSLESGYASDSKTNINPKFLISFNILRKNFNAEYISNVVKEFTDDVCKPVEIKLLKVVSLLNTYDPHFKPIPVSSLDEYLEQEQSSRFQKNARNVNWEALLSQGVEVLLNLSSGKLHDETKNSVRVFSKIIAIEILERMKIRTEQTERDIMLEILKTGVFEKENRDSKALQAMINRIFKVRDFKPDGTGKEKFSTFVMHVQSTEGAEKAAEALELLFELNKDPFTAQLIARFYIGVKNWERAERYAQKATRIFPSSSFLWDTYAQVFKGQLQDKISFASSGQLNQEEIHEVIELSEKCIDAFKEEQKVSEVEITMNGDNNFAGYFGELRAIVLLLSALNMCPSFKPEGPSFKSEDNILHQYLVDKDYNPEYLQFLDRHEADYLKRLEINAEGAMRRLDEEYLQMKSSATIQDIVTPSHDFNMQSLLYLKVNLDEYFGEAGDKPPQNLSDSQTCDYRRRLARKLGATSLNLLLKQRQKKETQNFMKIYQVMLENVTSPACTFDDIRIMLDVVTVLLTNQPDDQPDVKYETILTWCRKLYSMEAPEKAGRTYLEKFLYFVMYNFPTPDRQSYGLCYTCDLIKAIENWQKAFQLNYPKHERERDSLRRRETTLFFLGNGKPLHDVVYQGDLREMGEYSLQEKWQHPQVRDQLKLMDGVLCERGERVKIYITSKEGNKSSLSIQTSHRVKKTDLWQKKVYFYIGFSWSGPVAFGLSKEEPAVASAPHGIIKSQVYSVSGSRSTPQSNYSIIFDDLLKKRRQLIQLIELAHGKRREELQRDLDEIHHCIDKLMGEN